MKSTNITIIIIIVIITIIWGMDKRGRHLGPDDPEVFPFRITTNG